MGSRTGVGVLRNRTSTNLWVDAGSLILMIGLVATGGLIYFVMPAGTGRHLTLFGWNRHDIGEFHFYLAGFATAMLAVHLLLHWKWVCCVLSRALEREVPSPRQQATWGLAFVLGLVFFLVGGLWFASRMVREVPRPKASPAKGHRPS